MARKAEKFSKELHSILYDKMLDSGWTSIRSFTEGSNVPMSIETVRRVLSDVEKKGIAPVTIAIISKYLGFNPNEIKELLQTYTEDDDIWRLIGDHSNSMTQDEQAMQNIYHKIKQSGGDALSQFTTHLSLLDSAYGLGAAPDIKRIKR